MLILTRGFLVDRRRYVGIRGQKRAQDRHHLPPDRSRCALVFKPPVDAAALNACPHCCPPRRPAPRGTGPSNSAMMSWPATTSPALREVRQPAPLTAREREIISLVAQGLSNRRIAEEMCMSVRTVEGHLYRASQRSGANGRDQLAALLSEFDDGPS